MTPNGFYIRMIGSTKACHWLTHFIPDKLLLQEITYQTCISGVSISLLKEKKGHLPSFPFSTGMSKIENVKQEKDELYVSSSIKLREVNLQRHDQKG